MINREVIVKSENLEKYQQLIGKFESNDQLIIDKLNNLKFEDESLTKNLLTQIEQLNI